jgi:hypothetical protein
VLEVEETERLDLLRIDQERLRFAGRGLLWNIALQEFITRREF